MTNSGIFGPSCGFDCVDVTQKKNYKMPGSDAAILKLDVVQGAIKNEEDTAAFAATSGKYGGTKRRGTKLFFNNRFVAPIARKSCLSS